MKQKNTICIIGAGRMGETLVHGLTSSDRFKDTEIVITGRNEDRLQYLSNTYKVEATLVNSDILSHASVLLVCVKPQNAAELFNHIVDYVDTNQLLISIMAGVTLQSLERMLPEKMPIVRAMPNTPAQVLQGMTVITGGNFASKQHIIESLDIFSSIGKVIELPEVHFDAVTGLSASGPAFLYVAIESLAEGGVACGLPRDISTLLASQMTLGASQMVLETGLHPAILKDHVTTPAGCTIDGLLELEEGGFRVTLINAVKRAAQRASELG